MIGQLPNMLGNTAWTCRKDPARVLSVGVAGNAPGSLLVIKPSSLGDIVHGLQVVKNFALTFPECRITWVVRDRFAPLVEAAEFVDETIHFYRKQGWRGIWKVMRALRGRKFDIVWDMQGLLRSGLMTGASRSELKYGRRDAREGAGIFTNKLVNLPSGTAPFHAVAILQEFNRALGIDKEISFPLELRRTRKFSWEEFFEWERNRVFVVFTDSRGAGKEWLGFAALTQLIWKEIPDSRVAWCAGKWAEPLGDIPSARFLNLTGCPLDEMIALAQQPSVFVGNDSGPMHLSAATGNKVLAIFGPTAPERFGPWPVGSQRNLAVRAPGGVLADLSAEEVFCQLRVLCGRD